MIHRKLTVNKLLAVFAVFWLIVAAVSLFIIEWQYGQLQVKREVIKFQASEIRWLNYSTDKAKAQVVNLPELEFLAGVMETKDGNLHAIAKAAWKYGRRYRVSPYLILSVVHRESNFDPFAISYNQDSTPCAYGTMQINAAVWKPDMVRIFEIEYNVELGTKILKMYLEKNPGDISRGLWEYWGRGEVNTYSGRVLGSKFYDVQPVGVSQ